MAMAVAAVTFDGIHTAEQRLSGLRSSREDEWLAEVAVVEHHRSGRFATKATSPDYGDEGKVRAAIGTLTGVFLGLIGGPVGLVLWTGAGALTGGAVGDYLTRHGINDPLVQRVKEALPRNSSALMLVADKEHTDGLVDALLENAVSVIEHALTDEQIDELRRTSMIREA